MPLPSIDPSQMFSKLVRLITSVDMPSAPADIQGQGESATRESSVTERCNRLALLVTSPLILADRCEEEGPSLALWAKKHTTTSQSADMATSSVSHCPAISSELPVLLFRYQLFAQGQKVKRVDNTSGMIAGEREEVCILSNTSAFCEEMAAEIRVGGVTKITTYSNIDNRPKLNK